MSHFLSRLIGTMQDTFRIGKTGPTLKNNSGTFQLRNTGDTAWADAHVKAIQVQGTNATHGVQLQAPAGMGASIIYVLPAADGSTNQVLQTDGSGNLSWGSAGGGASDHTFEQAFSNSVDGGIFTPTANDRLRRILVFVSSPAAGGNPTLQIGTQADPDAYAGADDVDLKTAGTYEIVLDVDVGDPAAEVISTVSASGQSFSGQIYIERDPS